MATFDTHNTSSSSQGQELNRDLYLGIYSVFVICLLFFTLLRTQLFFKLTIVASRKLHEKMFNALLRAPSYFFDTNSIGESKCACVCTFYVNVILTNCQYGLLYCFGNSTVVHILLSYFRTLFMPQLTEFLQANLSSVLL